MILGSPRMYRMSCLFLCLALLTPTILAFNCSTPPIYSDIHNRTVAGSSVFQWGSFIGVGTAALHQALYPSLRRNETSFASSSFCSNSNLTDCITATGGNIEYNASLTWHQDANYSSLDTDPIGTSVVGGTDSLQIFTHYFENNPAVATNITDARVEFVNGGSVNPGVLGLGSASTILQRLQDNGLIAGRTLSFYLGTSMARAAGMVNGSITFGGHDSGRFQKPVHTYDMDLSSADYLPITVSDIVLDDPLNPKVHNVSLMHSEESFEGRITSDQYPMTLPHAITQRFMSTLSAEPSDSSDGSLRLTRPFNGTMTIVLSDGFQVTLPSETVYNISGLSPVAASNNSTLNGPFYLSAAWLGQVYLMLDYESSKFHLAQVIQKNAYVIPSTFCPGSVPEPYDYSRKASPFLKHGLIGVVIGAVVGGSALITLAVALFLGWRSRRVNGRQMQRWAKEEKAWGNSKADSVELSPLREKNRGMAASFNEQSAYAPVSVPTPYGGVERAVSERSSSPVSSICSADAADAESAHTARVPSALSFRSR